MQWPRNSAASKPIAAVQTIDQFLVGNRQIYNNGKSIELIFNEFNDAMICNAFNCKWRTWMHLVDPEFRVALHGSAIAGEWERTAKTRTWHRNLRCAHYWRRLSFAVMKTWLILLVICLSQRSSHACSQYKQSNGETANGSLKQLTSNSTNVCWSLWIEKYGNCNSLELKHAKTDLMLKRSPRHEVIPTHLDTSKAYSEGTKSESNPKRCVGS